MSRSLVSRRDVLLGGAAAGALAVAPTAWSLPGAGAARRAGVFSLGVARSLTGAEQERWLLRGLRSSRARWDVLGQQVMFAEIDYQNGPERAFNPDAWDGYVGSRQRVLRGWEQAGTRNPVVLTGDVHKHWANEIHDGDRLVGTELTTTSITSGGDGSAELTDEEKAYLAENPHVRFHRNQRGYVSTTITANEMRADYRVVPYVTKPGAALETAASFVIEDGTPGLNEA